MNLKQNTLYILSHPCFKYAIEQYNNGNHTEIESLLEDIQLHSMDVIARNASKEYGNCKYMNSADIKYRIQNIACPQNFSIELRTPVVEIQTQCTVINFKDRVISIKRKVARFINPMQLSLFEYVLQEA